MSGDNWKKTLEYIVQSERADTVFAGAKMTPVTEALNFMLHETADDFFLTAVCRLFLTNIPITLFDRRWLGCMLTVLDSPGKKHERAGLLKELAAIVREVQRASLKMEGIVGEKAEQEIAEREGVSIDALRQRTTRARRAGHVRRARRSE
jgi:hypothetical protein